MSRAAGERCFPSRSTISTVSIGTVSVVALISLALAGCRLRPSPPDPWNVLVVLVDTLRADRLGVYGYPRDTDPFLRSFANRGLVFESAHSQAGCTFPSVSSIFTSRSPQVFVEAIEEHGMAIPPHTPTMAQLLRSAGYSTAAVSASTIVRAAPSEINRQGGFDAGFDVFDESCAKGRAPCLNRRAQELLDELPQPFFLYLHYLEPHSPYRPPRWHQRRFATAQPDRRWVAQGDPRRLERHYYGETGLARAPSEAELEHFRNLYDEEVRFFDARFEELIRRLEERGLREKTVILLISDHGEALAEHHEDWGHCRDLAWQSLLRTPMILWLPEGPAGRRRSLVENLDVLPTLLDVLGLERIAPPELEGVSLRPVIEHDGTVHEFALSAQGTSRAWSDGRFKLLLDIESQSARLHDLVEDPGELEDRAQVHEDVVARALSSLRDWSERTEGAGAAERARRLEQQLEALGYLEGSGPDSKTGGRRQ